MWASVFISVSQSVMRISANDELPPYTVGTRAEDRALQGWNSSADSGASMTG